MEEENNDIDLSLAEENGKVENKKESGFIIAEEQKDDVKEDEKQAQIAKETRKMSVLEWLSVMKWHTNPFIFNIVPSLFVGYTSQRERILMVLEERHKFMLILGPTGSGKTTLLKWLSYRLKNYDILYIGKPPQKADDFVDIFTNKYRKPWYAFWGRKIKNIYEVPDFLSKTLRRKNLVVLLDEAHEANIDVLEWLRVLTDQVENMSVVLSGLPAFEDQLRSNLETFTKRITAKIELLSLTKEETKELIMKRIKNVGGSGNEFSDSLIDSVYEYTGGFPREIIRVCDKLVNNAIIKGKTQIEFDLHEKKEFLAEEKPVSLSIIEKMTTMQKEIFEMLSKKPMTPGQIANLLDLAKYKSRQHAVRSVNNIVKALHENGYLERRKEDKAFVYSLSLKLSTLFVKR